MAPSSVPIPLDALTVGTHAFGPVTAPDDVSQATITIDRTVSRPNANGLNGQPATTTLDIAVWQSSDDGTTWQLRASAGLIGGIYASNEAGDPYVASSVTVELVPGTGRRVRATVTVTGARVAVAGTLTAT